MFMQQAVHRAVRNVIHAFLQQVGIHLTRRSIHKAIRQEQGEQVGAFLFGKAARRTPLGVGNKDTFAGRTRTGVSAPDRSGRGSGQRSRMRRQSRSLRPLRQSGLFAAGLGQREVEQSRHFFEVPVGHATSGSPLRGRPVGERRVGERLLWLCAAVPAPEPGSSPPTCRLRAVYDGILSHTIMAHRGTTATRLAERVDTQQDQKRQRQHHCNPGIKHRRK